MFAGSNESISSGRAKLPENTFSDVVLDDVGTGIGADRASCFDTPGKIRMARSFEEVSHTSEGLLSKAPCARC
jgi:hypothetical protein